MNERPKDDIIERIRKLLTKTEANGCSKDEAESAFKVASRLMAEHNLDMAEIEEKDGPSSESFIEADAADTGKWTLEMNLAYGIVSEFFFVQGYFDRRTVKVGPVTYYNGEPTKETKERKVLIFFGTRTNVDAARFTYTALLQAFDRLFVEYRARSGCPIGDRRLFITGVAHGFSQKMRDERRAMEIERDITRGKSSGSTALVLASIAERTKLAYREAHPGHKKGNVRFGETTGSQSSLEAGIAAGKALNLNRAIGGSSQGRLTG
jgi:hypothetical protein